MTTNVELIKVVEPYTDSVIDEHISVKSLRKLVRKVKLGNVQAMDRLCRLYVLTVKEVYSNSLTKYLLGEDAVSIVWEIFIRFIKEYEGNNYRELPGLIKKQLQQRVINTLRKPGNYKYNVSPDSISLENTPRTDRELLKVHDNAGFYSLLEGCTPRQIKIAELYFMYQLEQNYIGLIMHCNERRVRYTLAKIVNKARDNYSKQKHIR